MSLYVFLIHSNMLIPLYHSHIPFLLSFLLLPNVEHQNTDSRQGGVPQDVQSQDGGLQLQGAAYPAHGSIGEDGVAVYSVY